MYSHSPSKSEQPAFVGGLPKQPTNSLGESANALDCADNGVSRRQAGSVWGRRRRSARAVTIVKCVDYKRHKSDNDIHLK